MSGCELGFQIHEELEQVVELAGVEAGMWQTARDDLRAQLIEYSSMECTALDALKLHIFGNPHEDFVSEVRFSASVPVLSAS